MAFFIPGPVLTSVSIFGGSAPETGYYKATVTEYETAQRNPASRKITLTFENGFSVSDFFTVPFDDQNQILAKYAEPAKDKAGNLLKDAAGNPVMQLDKKGRGCVAAIKTLLFSAGYDNSQMEGGATHEWLTNRVVHVEWHAAADLGAQYGEIEGYVTPKVYESLMAEGKKPAIAGAGRAIVGGSQAGLAPAPAVAGVASVTVQAAAPVPASAGMPPAPDNGAAAPSAGAALPPPPSVTSLVN